MDRIIEWLSVIEIKTTTQQTVIVNSRIPKNTRLDGNPTI